MPMYEALAMFFGGMAVFLGAALFIPHLKRDLARPMLLSTLLIGAAALSSVSALITNAGHAGTGFVTRYGWPKPFYFEYASEAGTRTRDLEPVYFAGNWLFYLGVLLIAWSGWRIVRR